MVSVILAAVLSAPNLVFISVDTLRADHLGCYGYPYDTSPNLDSLSTASLVFDDMVCEVPLTSPSFCAMMSSRFPRSTGTTRNGLRLPEGIPTVAEQFHAAGYETICVQSNWTLKASLSGLDRGFDVYEDAFRKKRWGFIKAERDADEVTRIALELLASRDIQKPLFAWFHYSDPHAPYKLHRNFNVAKSMKGMDRKTRKIRVNYDSEIAYTDANIGRLLEALPKENTFVVFVGDHGESLFEHGYLGHGRRIYQNGLHIPFMIRGPGVAAGRSAFPARGIDVGPTLLALAGLEPMPGMMGVDLLSGAAGLDGAGRARVVETYGGAVPRLPGARAIMAGRPPQRQGVLLDGWKLILDGQKAELFELGRDPKEERNLADTYPERTAELRRLVQQWDKSIARVSGTRAKLSEDDIEALRSLGYVE